MIFLPLVERNHCWTSIFYMFWRIKKGREVYWMHSKNIFFFFFAWLKVQLFCKAPGGIFHLKRAGEIKVQLTGGLPALILLSTTMKLKIKSQWPGGAFAKPDLFFPAGFAKGPINCGPISVTHIKQLADTNPHAFHELSIYYKNIISNSMHT